MSGFELHQRLAAYRRALMRKLQAHNLTELIVLALRAGIYNPPKS